MAAHAPADEKTAPADVAAQALHALETGLPEILADDTSGYVKQNLSTSPHAARGVRRNALEHPAPSPSIFE